MAASPADLQMLELEAARAEYERAEAEARYKRLLVEKARSEAIQHQPNNLLHRTVPTPPSTPPSTPPIVALPTLLPPASPPVALPTRRISVTPGPPGPVPRFSFSSEATEVTTKRHKASLQSLVVAVTQPLTPSSSESTTSMLDSNDEEESSQSKPRRRRHYRSKKLSGLRSVAKVGIKQRRLWLQHAKGDKDAPITQQLQVPPFYHPDLDAFSSADSIPVQPVSQPWQAQQLTMVRWFTEVLKYHTHKARHSSSDEDKEGESDWEQDYTEAITAGWASTDAVDAPTSTKWTARMLMPDQLYLELTKVLLDPNPQDYLTTLRSTQPQLHKVIQRQLDEHGRYHLFWAYADVCSVLMHHFTGWQCALWYLTTDQRRHSNQD